MRPLKVNRYRESNILVRGEFSGSTRPEHLLLACRRRKEVGQRPRVGQREETENQLVAPGLTSSPNSTATLARAGQERDEYLVWVVSTDQTVGTGGRANRTHSTG